MEREDLFTVRREHFVEYVANLKAIQRLISAKINEDEPKKESPKRCSVERFKRGRQREVITKRSSKERQIRNKEVINI